MERIKLAYVFGWIFLAVGACGFAPLLFSRGLLFGFLATDPARDLMYLGIGALGIVAARRGRKSSRLYLKCIGIAYAIFAIAGFVSGASIFGVMATNGAGNLIHLIIAMIALWAGFGMREPAYPQR